MDKDTFWWKLVHLEPALLRTLIVAVATLLGTFGVFVASDQIDAIIGFATVALIVVGGVSTRSAVTANARVVVEAPNPISDPGTVVAGEATTTASSAEIVTAAREDPRG